MKLSDQIKLNAHVAVIGMGCLFPKAPGLKEYWSLIANGVDGITDVPESHWSSDDYFDKDPQRPDHVYCKWGGFLSSVDFDPSEFGIPPNSLEATDTSQLLSLTAAKMALKDAGYWKNREFNRERTSVILGVTGTQELVIPLGARLGHPKWRKALNDTGIEPEKTEEVIQRISDSYVKWQENSFPGLLGNVVAGRIANRFNLGGTNCVVDAACASSMSAVNLGLMELIAGRSDMVLTGGADTLNDIFMHSCFAQTKILSPTGNASPFSENADGTVLGEGVGIVVLKRLEDAKKDNDKIYAVIKGIGSSSDGRAQSIYAPAVKGQAKSLTRAYNDADIHPDTVFLVEAHGTGTRVGDMVEFEALSNVFGKSRKSADKCAIGSVKSMIGHTKAAAGAAGLIKTIIALYNKILPPTLKAEKLDPKLKIDQSSFYINPQTRPWFSRKEHPRRAGVSSFGFGGSNFHIVLEEYEPDRTEISWDGSVEIIALSASSEKELINSLQSLKKGLGNKPSNREIAIKACKTRNDFVSEKPYRLLLTLKLSSDKTYDIEAVLTAALEYVQSKGEKFNKHKKNIFFRHPEKSGKPGKTAFVFSGQGSQYVNMGNDLVCRFPEAMTTIENARAAFDHSTDLADFIYPLPAQNSEQQKAQEQNLRQTDVAQPALGAISVSMLKILERFEIRPDATCGHSFGELTALHAAGRIDEQTLFHLAAARGRFMAMAGQGAEKGAMLAVKARISELETIVKSMNSDVILANKNSPFQGVLSGSTNAIANARKICNDKKFKTIQLPVAVAFHSFLVESAGKPFAETLKNISIKPTNIPVFSNTTGIAYPDDSEKAKQLLGKQLISPVEFVSEIQNIYRSGIRTFIEVGPKSALTGLIREILTDQEDLLALALDPSVGKRSGLDLARLLCELASAGHYVKLDRWETPCPEIRKQRMSIPVSGVNYTKPTTEKKLKHCLNINEKQKSFSDSVISEDLTKNVQELKPQPRTKTVKNSTKTVKNSAKTVKDSGFDSGAYSTSNQNKVSISKMNKKTQQQPRFATDALQVIYEGLKSMQTLQTQTASTHTKFLETQSEATRTLQYMMDKTRSLAELAMGLKPEAKIPANIEKPAHTSFVEDHPAPEPLTHPEHFSDTTQQSWPVKDQSVLQPQTLSFESEQFIQPESVPEKESVVEKEPVSEQSPVMQQNSEQSSIDNNYIQSTLVEVVSELTGYPVEMLGMDMDIEADLGIDSIKRVEILSSLEEKIPGLPSVSPDVMGTLKTLGLIVKHLTQKQTDSSTEEQKKTSEHIQRQEHEEYAAIDRSILSFAEKALEKRDKLSVPKNRKILITQDKKGLSRAIADELISQGFNADLIPESVFLNIEENKKAIQGAAGIIIVVDIGEQDHRIAELFLKNSLLLAKHAAPELIKSADNQGALFATITRIDGVFGFKENGMHNPITGGLAGLTKTAAIEWEKVICRAIDVDPGWNSDKQIARAIADELLFAASNVQTEIEVGLSQDSRVAPVLEKAPWPEGKIDLNEGDPVIISGGARGVTAAGALALARHVKPAMILLGRSPAPFSEPEWLFGLEKEARIKQAILKNHPEQLSVLQLNSIYKQYIANREITKNIDLIRQAGSDTDYFQVDVRDGKKINEIFNQVRSSYGRIRAIIHGAGILKDRLITDKTPDQFDAVFSTKVDGLKNLLSAANNDQLKYIMLFSSVSARFGNKGQADYAMANEVLNKIAHEQSAARSDCRVVALNWGPWDCGMVSPAIKRQFEENNVGVIPKQAGAGSLVSEMSGNRKQPVEVVISAKPPYETTDQKLSLAAESELNLQTHPVLESHVIDGKPVVPFALISEWLSHGALHENPGLQLYGLDQMRVLQGIRLNNGTKKIRIMAGQAVKNGSLFEVNVEIRNGIRKNGQDLVHAKAKAILTDQLHTPPQLHDLELTDSQYPRTTDQVYEHILFHGNQLRGINNIINCSEKGMTAQISAAPLPHEWIKQPLRSRWIGDPLVLDSAFQMATVWCFEQKGAPSLPTYSHSYRQYVRNFPDQGVTAIWKVESVKGHIVKGDFTFLTPENRIAAQLQGFEAVMDQSLSKAFKKRSV